MCKHQTITAAPATAVAAPPPLASIGAIFQAWVQASLTLGDHNAPPTARNRAKDRMTTLWDDALDMPVSNVQDMAAVYIMANRTPAIDPDAMMETAHCLVHTACHEAEMVRLYNAWTTLYDGYDTLKETDQDPDKTLDIMHAQSSDIEHQIAAIAATTPRMLAIKVDVFRNHVEHTTGARSLAADLATWTGIETRPA